MFTLKAEKRETQKKANKMSREGKIPAVFYGRKETSTPILISFAEFLKTWKEAGESTIISLSYAGKDLPALIHEVAVDPVLGTPIHVDFYVTEADRAVEVQVPLVFRGEAGAAKELGGMVTKVLHELPISGLPKDLPHEILVDLSLLKALDSVILVKDLKLPPGVKTDVAPTNIVVSISVVKEEVEEPAEFDASSIEVEKKGKQDELAETPELEGAEKEKGGTKKEKAN